MKKIITIFLLFLNITPLTSDAQDFSHELSLADSLFQQNKYVEAHIIYHSIFEKGGQYSNEMLLKMAFINEGLEENAEALYYLNLYYLSTLDERVLTKMETLSEDSNLSGYEYDELGYFLNLYKNNNTAFLLALYCLLFIQLAILLYVRLKKKRRPFIAGFIFLMYAMVIYYFNNFEIEDKKAIINKNYTFLMEAPSQASKLKRVEPKGQRVEIEKTIGPWTKIEFDEKFYYVKSAYLRNIAL